MATRLGDAAIGTIVKIKEEGIPKEYIVIHHGNPNNTIYDDSCNGTWLMQNVIRYVGSTSIPQTTFSFSGATSMIDIMNNIYLKLFDDIIKNSMKEVYIPYTDYSDDNPLHYGKNGHLCKLFLLSGIELGWSGKGTSVNTEFPIDGAKLSYFYSGTDTISNNRRIANSDSPDYPTCSWWTRSPNIYPLTEQAVEVISNGTYLFQGTHQYNPLRITMIMPDNMEIDDDGNISLPSPPTIEQITVSTPVTQGQDISISWTADANATKYVLERNVDAGGYTQVYEGSETTYTDHAEFTWNTSVQYRVKGINGTVSGEYAESTQVTITKVDFTVSNVQVPAQVYQKEKIVVTWDKNQNATQYKVERKLNGAQEWVIVYQGDALSYTDTTTKEWTSAQYRLSSGNDVIFGTTYTTSSIVTVVPDPKKFLKEQINRKNADGSYSIIHYETDASIVMQNNDDSTTLEDLVNRCSGLASDVSYTGYIEYNGGE